jgi:hypothetical protein
LQSIVITSGIPSVQRAKIEHSGVSRIVSDVLYAGLTHKGDAVAARNDGDAVFVDDSPSQIDAVLKLCPSIRPFEMRRDGKEASGKYPVVHDLSELEAAVLK